MAFSRQSRRLQEQIRSLESRCPRGMDPNDWRDAVGWAENAYGNICITHHTISPAEMTRIADEMEARLGEPVGPQTLLWVWDRLGRTRRQGRGYNRRHRIRTLAPLIEEALLRGAPADVDPAAGTRSARSIKKACEEIYYRSGCDLMREDGPRDEADALLSDLGALLPGASAPGGAGRILDRLARSSEYGRERIERLRAELPGLARFP